MKKQKVRLTDFQAQALGLAIKPRGNTKGNPKYFLTAQQVEDLKQIRISELEGKPIHRPIVKEPEKPFVLSAWNKEGGVMNITEYCLFHSLPYDDVRSYKLVSHTGIPFYNIQFKEKIINDVLFNEDEIKDIITDRYKKIRYDERYTNSDEKTIVSSFADFHFGADVERLIKTPNYNSDILANRLFRASQKINGRNSKLNHVHILGDLIESFTGLNHKNSFKSLNKHQIGAEAIIGCTNMLHQTLLNNVNNLGCIKIVAGNHDRITSARDEDQDGDAAKLIAYSLSLMGYDVEFHSDVLTHLVDGVNHINMHGHNAISKKSTEKIILDYGIQGQYNLIKEGHLHSQIEGLSDSQKNNFKVIKDDYVDYKRIVLTSLFTGNKFSERLGFSSCAGFNMISSEGGIPEIDNRVL